MAGAGEEACTCETFLEKNKVKKGWQDFILGSWYLKTELTKILHGALKDEEKKKELRPDYDKILNAFSHAEPCDIKVVIIGTSPAATNSIANGLAFSSDRKESTFREQQAIAKVHKALRKAKILKLGSDHYSCDHQKWAENGVLLLNAALTIREAERESATEIKNHCELWLKFLKGLLFEWIDKTPVTRHNLFVMRWGACAERVWSKIDKNLEKPNIHAFSVIDHPTFPKGDQNNFLTEAPGHFKIISEQHQNIFCLEPLQDEVNDVRGQMEKKLRLKTKKHS